MRICECYVVKHVNSHQHYHLVLLILFIYVKCILNSGFFHGEIWIFFFVLRDFIFSEVKCWNNRKKCCVHVMKLQEVNGPSRKATVSSFIQNSNTKFRSNERVQLSLEKLAPRGPPCHCQTAQQCFTGHFFHFVQEKLIK